MREIKFRAWDGKKMLDWDDVWLKPLAHWMTGAHSEVLMQYTGLTDRNGKEIYESDIVEHRNFLAELLGIYEVRNSGWSFTLHDIKQPEIGSHYITPSQLEIIGNIYENLELLEVSNAN